VGIEIASFTSKSSKENGVELPRDKSSPALLLISSSPVYHYHFGFPSQTSTDRLFFPQWAAEMGYIGETISVSNTDWFTEEEVGIDLNGSELCPVCGCCSVKQAVVVPDFDSIFEEAAYRASGKIEKTKEFRLVCRSRCRRGQPHLRA
jgi:hypothetical protein